MATYKFASPQGLRKPQPKPKQNHDIPPIDFKLLTKTVFDVLGEKKQVTDHKQLANLWNFFLMLGKSNNFSFKAHCNFRDELEYMAEEEENEAGQEGDGSEWEDEG